MAAGMEQRYCSKCNRTMNVDNFYQSKNEEKYPDKYLNICKKCITMHVNNWEPDTYLWILQECDVPYIPDEWNSLLAKYGKDKTKLTGATILGRYLSKMKLKQYKEYRWKDTDFLRELNNNKIEQAMKQQGYDIQAITEAINKVDFEVPEEELSIPQEVLVKNNQPEYTSTAYDLPEPTYSYNAAPEEDDSITAQLTDEDKLMLRVKWGKTYKPDEWVQLEKLYNEMMESYDIQSAGHIDTLKMICKTSLKANQLLDIGDRQIIMFP